MWFRRDLRLADNPALLEAAARRRRAAALRARPGAVGPGRPGPPAPTSPPRCARSTPRCGSAAARLSVVRGDPVRRVVRGRAEVGRRARARRRRLRPLRPPRATSEVEQALAEHGIELVRTGSPYAVAPGRVDQRRRASPTRSSRRSRGRGPSTAGAARSTPPTGARLARARRTPPTSPTPTLPDGLDAARGRRGGGAAALARSSSTSGVGDYDDDRDRPGVDGTSRMSVHLKWGEIHPRTMLADLARLRGARRGDLPQGAGLAGVLRRRAVPPARRRAREYLRPEFARMAYDEPGDQLEAWQRGPHRLPDRRRRACASCARPAGCTTGCG